VVVIVVVIVVVALSQYGPLVDNGSGLLQTDTSFEAQFTSFHDPLLSECVGCPMVRQYSLLL